jgi:hypothetical protein
VLNAANVMRATIALVLALFSAAPSHAAIFGKLGKWRQNRRVAKEIERSRRDAAPTPPDPRRLISAAEALSSIAQNKDLHHQVEKPILLAEAKGYEKGELHSYQLILDREGLHARSAEHLQPHWGAHKVMHPKKPWVVREDLPLHHFKDARQIASRLRRAGLQVPPEVGLAQRDQAHFIRSNFKPATGWFIEGSGTPFAQLMSHVANDEASREILRAKGPLVLADRTVPYQTSAPDSPFLMRYAQRQRLMVDQHGLYLHEVKTVPLAGGAARWSEPTIQRLTYQGMVRREVNAEAFGLNEFRLKWKLAELGLPVP